MKVWWFVPGMIFLSSACNISISDQGSGIIAEIDRSQLDGEWYAQATLVAKQAHSGLAFVGLACSLDRVRFVVTEDRLLAFRSYENGQALAKAPRDQTLVAAFRINHVGRDQGKGRIGVDWSENLSPHLECNGWLSSITAKNLDNLGDDPTDPFRVRIEGDYMEATINAMVQPDLNMCRAIGEQNCHGSRYRVKFSFKRIDGTTRYEPKHYPKSEPIRVGQGKSGFCLAGDDGCRDAKELWLYSDAVGIEPCDPLRHDPDRCFLPSVKLNANFGFFTTDVEAYDRREGFTRRGRREFINRHDLWVESFYEGGEVIPLKLREPKKLIYYLNPGFPRELMPAIRRVEAQWNTAFTEVVAKAKGRSRMDIERAYGEIFAIRENDCNAARVMAYSAANGLSDVLASHGISPLTDDNVENACAVLEWLGKKRPELSPFTWQRIGDVRYNFINAIPKPEATSLLGYGPSSVDPTTGEVISGQANVYLSAITRYAARRARLVEYLKRLRPRLKKGSDENDDGIDRLSAKLDRTVRSISKEPYVSVKSELLKNLSKAGVAPYSELMSKPFPKVARGDGNDDIEAVLDMIAGPLDTSAGMKGQERFLSSRNACFFNAERELSFGRLGEHLKDMPMTERIGFIRERVFEATIAHELGHTFGLRHNFMGAYDAINYPAEFWGISTHDHGRQPKMPKDELRSSSVMDYHMRFSTVFPGIGHYDQAALLAGYAGKVEVFDTDGDDFVPKKFMNKLHLMSYLDLPYLFAGGDADQRISRHYHQVMDRYLLGDGSAHMRIAGLGITPRAENLYRRRVIDIKDLPRVTFDKIFGGPMKKVTAVPYAFCTDGQAGGDRLACRPFVYGSSASEILESAIEDYEIAHEVEGLGGKVLPAEIRDYLSHAHQRVYAPILRIFKHMYGSLSDEQKIFPAIHDLMVGTKIGLDFIFRVLQAVAPGEYCKNRDGEYEPRADGQDCREPITIDGILGRPYKSSTAEDLFGTPLRVGFVYDKLLALLVLIDQQGISLASGQQNGSIGLYDLFKEPMVRIFGHIYLNNWRELAPAVKRGDSGELRITYKDLFGPDQVLAGTPIKPALSSMLRDYAILFSMAGLSSHADHRLDFAKRAQIVRLKPSDSPLGHDRDQITFKDPMSGLGYQAHAEYSRFSPGYLLLEDAMAFAYGDGSSGQGEWVKARLRLSAAEDDLKRLRDGMASTDELRDAEGRAEQARRDFEDKSKTLNEKMRVIERIAVLSKRFTE